MFYLTQYIQSIIIILRYPIIEHYQILLMQYFTFFIHTASVLSGMFFQPVSIEPATFVCSWVCCIGHGRPDLILTGKAVSSLKERCSVVSATGMC
jgi:hypothetical protein